MYATTTSTISELMVGSFYICLTILNFEYTL